MAAPWKCFQSFFSFGCKFYKQSGCKGQSQTASPIKHQTPHLDPENIRESILDFTALLGEINPDMLYLCRRGQSGLKMEVFAFFPSVRRGAMKKNVKSSIFRKKTSKFLSSLPFKTQTTDNQWEYDDASTCNKAPNYNNIILILATLSGSVTADNGGIFSASYMVVMVGTIISDFDDMRYNKLVRIPNGSSRDDSGIASI